MFSQGLPGEKQQAEGSSVSLLKTFPSAIKFAFKFRPVFSLLLLATALTFAVLAVFNSHTATMTIVGIPEIVHVTSAEKQTLEFVPLGTLNTSQEARYLPIQPPEAPLLTLFTTFKNRRDRWRIHWNVLKNWSLFLPEVRIILFNDRTEESLIHFAREMNWTVLPVPAKSLYGTPLLKHMYFACQKQVPNSMFYGYANGDILFGRGLVDTLKLVGAHLDTLMPSLIIGRRTNFRVRGRRITTLREVHTLAKTEGKLFRSDAEDYFFLAHNEFPWKAVPNIVIGRPTYDNFLVATAAKYSIAVIDATKTLVALHQTGVDGDFAGHHNKDSNYNSRVIGRFDYSRGLTSTSQYLTQYTKDEVLELWRRAGAGEPAMLLTPASPVTEPANTGNRSLLEDQGATQGINHKVEGAISSNISTDTTTLSPHNVSSNYIRNHHNLTQAAMNATLNMIESNHKNDSNWNEIPLNVNITNESIPDLLTLFTVFNSNPGLRDIHLNVIKNWAFYHPNVATVLFSDSKDSQVDMAARGQNWTVLPRVQQVGKVLPLKKMFLQVQNTFPNSKFYGYLSGDLVFGEGLVRTVSVVYQALEEIDNALVVGVKNRYLINGGQHLYEPAQIKSIIKTRASHIHPDFDENFLLAHAMFPWQHIPDLVIGRSVYDNYLVALALRHDFAVIDSTRTLIALDQMTSDTTLIQNELEDFDPNLLGALDYTSGFASSAQYETTYDQQGNIHLWKRQKEGKKPILQSYQRK